MSNSKSMKTESTDAKQIDQETFDMEVAQIPKVWADNIKEVLFTSDMIKVRVAELGAQLSADYEGKEVLFIGLLTGAFPFVADILRTIKVPYQIDFMSLSSYGKGTTSSGTVKLKKDCDIDPAGKHVVILEDLIDTGNTLAWVKEHLKTKNVASAKLCCLLDKSARRAVDIKVDYVGWKCPDEFVVGYGMDFSDNYRCLPFVGVLKPSAYS